MCALLEEVQKKQGVKILSNILILGRHPVLDQKKMNFMSEMTSPGRLQENLEAFSPGACHQK
ncbi:hypothetical protein A7K99_17680 [Tatumella citrea]|uniref:Uncharacterized protein n=1 Tax=Tatumella citrea TaxID=53336 RepID=A0A1Y0LCB0_TATCI|nr:hypothetical protein A7K98_17695 [Tatumella citrea]ARU99456.1 hypothetical protein A7K99_17680 [Tatumella citrea]